MDEKSPAVVGNISLVSEAEECRPAQKPYGANAAFLQRNKTKSTSEFVSHISLIVVEEFIFFTYYASYHWLLHILILTRRFFDSRFFSNAACKRLVAPIPWGGEEEAQEEAPCSESQLLLYGCKMSRYSVPSWMWPDQTWISASIVISSASDASYRFLCCNWCPVSFLGCYKITTVFSHAQTVVLCVGCSTVLCQPTGGKARLTEGQYPPAMFKFISWFHTNASLGTSIITQSVCSGCCGV